MKFLVYCRINEDNIKSSLGEPEYSYYFVFKAFLPLLETLGTVKLVRNPMHDVDPEYLACREKGEACVFLSFSAPHGTWTELQCPVIPVFAWEYSTIPDEDWDDGMYNNWQQILSRCFGAFTHSSYSVAAVRKAMGEDYPVISIPSPVWDQAELLRRQVLKKPDPVGKLRLAIKGYVLDSRETELDMPLPTRLHVSLREQLSRDVGEAQHIALSRTRQLDVSCQQNKPAPEEPRTLPEAERAAEAVEPPLNEAPYHFSLEEIPENDTPPLLLRVSAVRALQETSEKLRSQTRELKDIVLSLHEQVLSKQKDLQHKQAEISRLGQAILEKEAELHAKQEEIYRLSDAIRDKERDLRHKQEEIYEFHRKFRRMEDGLSPELTIPPQDIELSLSGIIYTSVFNPVDGRKNWRDMLTAFCTALRDCDDAVLVCKITHHRLGLGLEQFLDFLQRLPPFRCRIVVLWGFLEQESYENLIVNSTYVLNTSFAEGQCMPLMEYMSCGIPAVAPCSTAMQDYIDEDNAFVVASSPEPMNWQHDARRAIRTEHFRPNWQSLCEALTNSYECAKNQPQRYRQMQHCAVERLQQFCSHEVVSRRIQQFQKEYFEELPA